MHGDPGSAPSALAAEFRSALETNPAGTAALAPHWATLTVPASRGGRGLDQAAAVTVAEETGRAGRDGTLLDMIAAAETLAAAGPGPAAEALDGLATGTDVPAVSWWPAPGERHESDGAPPGHRDFAVGLPATTALLRLPSAPGAGERFALVALHGATWRPQPGLHGEPRHRLNLEDRADLRRPAVVDVDAGAAPGGSGPSPADLDGIRRAAYLWGLGDAAVGAAVRRARERHQFGVPIGRHQAVAFPLAALTARLRATRLLIHSTAAATDPTAPTGPAVAHDPAVAAAPAAATGPAAAHDPAVAADPAAATGPAVAHDPAAAAAADPAASIGPAADDEDKRPFTERVARLVRHTGELALDATWCALHLHGAHGLTDASPAQLLYRRALFHTALLRPGRHPHPPYSRRT